MSRTKVLVTGGTGFVGSAIVKALVESRLFDVTALDLDPPALGTSTFSEVQYVRGNVLHADEVKRVFEEVKPTAVIHTVGVYGVGERRYTRKGWEEIWNVNVEGTKNVVDASRECRVRALVS
jgi:sterol-4alpha-carboxylate 3-dehydrogenase (decarboxylating)